MDAKKVIIHDSSEDAQPEKYGRTLARDAETLQRGGVPDWAPLSQAARERLIAESPAPSPAAPSPSSPRLHTLTPPLVTPIETYVGGDIPDAAPPAPAAKERLITGSPIAVSVPTPPPAASPPPPRPSAPAPPLVTPIETYAGDFLDMVKKTSASSATVLAAEQDKEKRSPVPQELREQSRGNLLYIVAGAVLLVAGAAGAYVAYTRYLSALAPVTPLLGVSAPIFVDEKEQVSGSGPAILKAVDASVARPPAQGAVRLLYGATATTSIVATLLAKAPDIVLRNANGAGSMAGIVNAGGSTSLFFILSVSSYGNTFSGMLWWEKTMPRDLSALWGAYPALTSATASTSLPPASGKAPGATTTATTTVARSTGFRDEVIGNHDARVYRDEAGRSVLLYGYWDKTTLILARDPSAFIEILQRLATSRAR